MVTGFDIDNQNLLKEQIKVLNLLVGQLRILNQHLANMGKSDDKDDETYNDSNKEEKRYFSHQE